MSTVIFKTLATFFIIYGIIEMFSKLLRFFKLEETDKKEIFIFIHVKNQENSLEYIIRSTIFKYLENYGGRIVPYIVVVDKGSEDRTKEICERLCKDYDFLYYATEEEYLNFKEEIS